MEETNFSQLAKSFKLNLQEFAYENNVLPSAIGYSIGIVTKDVISSILDKIFLPGVLYLVNTSAKLKYAHQIKIFIEKNTILHDIINVIWMLMIWLLTIFLLYLLLEQFINRTVLGLQTVIPKSKQNDFMRSILSNDGTHIEEEIEKNNNI